MESRSCTRCSGKIPAGVAHACASHDYQFPIALEILAELQRIRELLEQPLTVRNSRKPQNDIT
jgi:hypothetical protein